MYSHFSMLSRLGSGLVNTTSILNAAFSTAFISCPTNKIHIKSLSIQPILHESYPLLPLLLAPTVTWVPNVESFQGLHLRIFDATPNILQSNLFTMMDQLWHPILNPGITLTYATNYGSIIGLTGESSITTMTVPGAERLWIDLGSASTNMVSLFNYRKNVVANSVYTVLPMGIDHFSINTTYTLENPYIAFLFPMITEWYRTSATSIELVGGVDVSIEYEIP